MNDAEKMDKLRDCARSLFDAKVFELEEILEAAKAGEIDDKAIEEASRLKFYIDSYIANVTPALKAVKTAAESGDEEEVSRKRDELFDELEKLADIDDNTRIMFEKIVDKLVDHGKQLVDIRKDIEELRDAVFNESASKSSAGRKSFKKSDKPSEQPASERDATDDKSNSKGGLFGNLSDILRNNQFSEQQLPNRDAVSAA